MGLTTKEISSSSFNDMISSVDRRSEYVENRAGANVRLNNFLTPYTLDDKSSILNAPCGYSNGVYPSLRPVGGENLLLQSNQFDAVVSNYNWINTNTSLTSGQSGYDGGSDAWKIDISAAYAQVEQNVSNSGVQTFSVYAKAGTLNWLRLRVDHSTFSGTYFNLQNGVIGTKVRDIDSNIEDLGGGWYRCSLTFNYNTTKVRIYPAQADNDLTATSGNIYIQDAQLERGPRANKYIETTTSPAINADFSFTRGSAATRVTKDGLIKNVQILSDDLVQNGNFEQIGPEEVTNGDFSQISGELITNGDFATDSDWNLTGATISGGKVNVNSSSPIFIIQNNVATVGKQYKVELTVSDYVEGDLRLRYPFTISESEFTGNGTYVFYGTADDARFELQGRFSGQTYNYSIDNVSVKEVGQDWDFTDGATITDNGVRVVSDGTYQRATQYNILTVGKQYKIQYEIVENNSGNLKMSSSFGLTPIPSTVGTHTIYGEAIQAFLTIERSGACDITITNISVKEVGQNWSFNTGWSMGDGVAIGNASIGTGSIYQQGVFEIGKKYQLKLDATLTSGSFKLEGSGGSTLYTFDETKSYDVIIEATQVDLMFRRITSSFIGTIDNISIIEITDDTDLPRIDYTNGTGSLLLEPQSTNLYSYSEDFTQSLYWEKNEANIISNSIVSPDGTVNASKFEIKLFNTTPFILDNINVTAGDYYTQTVYAKADEYYILQMAGSTGFSTNFQNYNLLNGTLGNNDLAGTNVKASIESVGNGWYRCSLSIAATVTMAGRMLIAIVAEGGGRLYNVGLNANEGIYIWGAQMEKENTVGYSGEYPTSYIPTSGSTVTRNADVCINAGSSDLINSTEGVLYAEISGLVEGGDIRCISLFSAADNRITLALHSTTNRIQLFIAMNGYVNTVDLDATDISQTNMNKIACKFKANDYALWINGVEKDTNTTQSNTVQSGTLNSLNFDINGSNNFYGRVRSVAVFKEALTDEELAKITSTTQQEAFYEMRDKMLQINADYYEFGDYTTRLKKLF